MALKDEMDFLAACAFYLVDLEVRVSTRIKPPNRIRFQKRPGNTANKTMVIEQVPVGSGMLQLLKLTPPQSSSKSAMSLGGAGWTMWAAILTSTPNMCQGMRNNDNKIGCRKTPFMTSHRVGVDGFWSGWVEQRNNVCYTTNKCLALQTLQPDRQSLMPDWARLCGQTDDKLTPSTASTGLVLLQECGGGDQLQFPTDGTAGIWELASAMLQKNTRLFTFKWLWLWL